MKNEHAAAQQLIAPDAHRVFASLIRGFAPVNSSVSRQKMKAKLESHETALVGEWIESNGKVVADDNCQRIQSLLQNQLVRLADADGGWSILMRDPSDDRLWELTYPHSEHHGGGPPALFYISKERAKEKYNFGG